MCIPDTIIDSVCKKGYMVVIYRKANENPIFKDDFVAVQIINPLNKSQVATYYIFEPVFDNDHLIKAITEGSEYIGSLSMCDTAYSETVVLD